MTTTFDNATTSERPTDGSGLTHSPEQTESLPAIFWAAVILFVVNLIVLIGIWLSPPLRVSMYGQDTGLSAGSYPKPSAFTERVEMTAARKPKQPEKVRPVIFQAPEIMENASVTLPRPTPMPVSMSGTANAHAIAETYSEYPRMTASAAPAERLNPIRTIDGSLRRTMVQP